METLSTIISILGMLGLTEMQTFLKDKYARKEGVSEDDILKAISAINNNTRNLNDAQLSKINAKLNAITFPAGMSENVKGHIYSIRNRLNKDQQNLVNKINEIERNVNSIDERARVYMSLDPNTRVANKRTILDLIDDAAKENENAGGDINTNKFTERIENSINTKTPFDKMYEDAKNIGKTKSI